MATLLSLEEGKTFLEAKGKVNYDALFISRFAEEAWWAVAKSLLTDGGQLLYYITNVGTL